MFIFNIKNMFYKCNKCGKYTWCYDVKKYSQVIKNWKRRNLCPQEKCNAYNNKNEEKKYLEENPKWFNNGCFQDEKWILKSVVNIIE